MLELSSNTIKALGIFGRLTKEQEEYFDALEKKYSNKSKRPNGYDVFRHLTLTFIHDASISDVRDELDLFAHTVCTTGYGQTPPISLPTLHIDTLGRIRYDTYTTTHCAISAYTYS